MIDHVLRHLIAELNDYLYVISPPAAATPDARKRVVGASLYGPDDKLNDATKDKIVASVVNVQEERVYHSVNTFKRRADGTSELLRPEIKVNLFVLLVANLGDYPESMKALSRVIAFFQHRNRFEYRSIAELSNEEGHFTVELFSMTFEQQNHLWGSLGSKYMPSVMFKVGIVDIRDEQVLAEVPPVQEITVGDAYGGSA